MVHIRLRPEFEDGALLADQTTPNSHRRAECYWSRSNRTFRTQRAVSAWYIDTRLTVRHQYFSEKHWQSSALIPACGSIVHGRNGTITSPNYPAQYPPNSLCKWEVVAPIGYHIELKFNAFEMQRSTNCTKDYLKVSVLPLIYSRNRYWWLIFRSKN